MSFSDLAPIFSSVGIIGGLLLAVSRWLWKRFELRMDQGDAQLEAALEQGDAHILTKLEDIRTGYEITSAKVSHLEIENATRKGQAETLIAIFGKDTAATVTSAAVNAGATAAERAAVAAAKLIEDAALAAAKLIQDAKGKP